MTVINMNTIGKLAKGVCNILVSGSIIALSCESFKMNIGQYNTYSGAVEAIMNSSMLSEYKSEAIGLLKRDEEKEYYKAVISIVKSNDIGSEKVKILNALNH